MSQITLRPIAVRKTFTFVALALLASLTACTRSCSRQAPVSAGATTPEEAVRRFVELSASAKDAGDKAKLEILCSGEMRRAFERMTDEVFRIAYLAGGIRISGVKILETVQEADAARVRYQVAVENSQGTDPTKEINEREVELSRSQGGWYIDSIRLKGSDNVAFVKGMMF